MLEKGMILIDRYEILSKAGAGGMSDVYKAKDHILGRIVAIKVMKAEFSEDVNFVTKFRSEAQSAAGLEHPNIVNIYDVGSENGLHFIVMEYVEGITLKTYIEKKGQLSYKEAASIAIQVAKGIETAHNKDIIHRDIKPQNIIISTEGKVKVTDFGIARAISSNTISAEVMGSVHYASPEQARNGFVDGRSDIYSLGIVMYEMVTGRVPFDGDTTVSVAIQHLQEEMVGPSVYAPDLPISFEKIVLKATQKNADRRYQTIEELVTDLRRSLDYPDEDFVVIAPAAIAKTRVIGGEELEAIQSAGANMDSKNDFVHTSEPDDVEEYDEDDDYDDYEEDDDDTTGFLNPTLEKVVNVVLIALALLITAAVIWLGISIAGLLKGPGSSEQSNSKPTQSESSEDVSSEEESSSAPTESEELVEMIDIVGLHEDKAREYLKALGLEMNVMSSESSDLPDGTVLYQSEIKGSSVPKGFVINVITAGDNESLVKKAVPDVLGYDEAVAKAILEAAGFLMEVDYDYSETVEKDLICAQDPAPGEKVKVGSRIKVTISLGKAPVMIPENLVGETQSVAEYVLVDTLGFVVEIATEYSEDITPGYVISVEGAGTNVPYGSIVVVHVSIGPEPTESEEPTETEEPTESEEPTDTEDSSDTEDSTEAGGDSSESESESQSEGDSTSEASEGDPSVQDMFSQFLKDLFNL